MNNKEIITTIVCVSLVAALVYLVYYNCQIKCEVSSGTEGYTRTPLSSIGDFHRSPVTYAFRGNGFDENPHYQADPQDRLVPAELGGVNPYNREFTPLEPLGRYTTDAKECQWVSILDEWRYVCGKTDADGAYVVNDTKTRRDLIDAGDMQWYRTLNNMKTSDHKDYYTERTYEMDAVEDLKLERDIPPLYSPAFHYEGSFLGQ